MGCHHGLIAFSWEKQKESELIGACCDLIIQFWTTPKSFLPIIKRACWIWGPRPSIRLNISIFRLTAKGTLGNVWMLLRQDFIKVNKRCIKCFIWCLALGIVKFFSYQLKNWKFGLAQREKTPPFLQNSFFKNCPAP